MSFGLFGFENRATEIWITNITLHYITLSAFQTLPIPKVTSGASTITCYTKYSPPAQHAG